VLAGDAGGFFDGITGEGMSLALATAPACADAIERYLDSGTYQGFQSYEHTRHAMERNTILLGRLTLALARDYHIAGYAIGNLGRHPETFARLIAVGGGQAGLASLRPADALALAVGW
jgi:2-polyprenyl-6-methoxyphenol hydroxylase-like FAD-dependent oxidoreductase